jgi:hypothetical protein
MTGRTGVGVRGCGPVQITQLCVHYVRRRRPKSTAHRRLRAREARGARVAESDAEPVRHAAGCRSARVVAAFGLGRLAGLSGSGPRVVMPAPSAALV